MESGCSDFQKSQRISPRQRWTYDRVAELTRLWDLGMRTRDIAAHLGVSNGSVCGKARRIGLPIRDCNVDNLRPNGYGEANSNWRGGREGSKERRKAKEGRGTNPLNPPIQRPRKPKIGRICFLLGYREW